MEKRKEPCSLDNLCLLTGMGKTSVIIALARLLSDGLVKREQPIARNERFSFHAPQLTKELQQLDKDVDAICFSEFTEEEIIQLHNLEERINKSILKHLQPETAKES